MSRFACRIGALVAVVVLSMIAGAWAQEHKKQDIVVHKAWARTTIANRPGAAFVTIENRGQADDRLIAAATASAARAELHSHAMDGGVMKMRKVEAIHLPTGAVAELKPGGFHIMLFGLAEPLIEGQAFPLTLTFEQAGDIAVMVKVKGMAANSMEHGNHDKGQMKKD